MKHLTANELMAIRIALDVERAKLEMFVKAASDPHAKASYAARVETVQGLLIDLAPGAAVTITR